MVAAQSNKSAPVIHSLGSPKPIWHTDLGDVTAHSKNVSKALKRRSRQVSRLFSRKLDVMGCAGANACAKPNSIPQGERLS